MPDSPSMEVELHQPFTRIDFELTAVKLGIAVHNALRTPKLLFRTEERNTFASAYTGKQLKVTQTQSRMGHQPGLILALPSNHHLDTLVVGNIGLGDVKLTDVHTDFLRLATGAAAMTLKDCKIRTLSVESRANLDIDRMNAGLDENEAKGIKANMRVKGGASAFIRNSAAEEWLLTLENGTVTTRNLVGQLRKSGRGDHIDEDKK